MKVFKKILIGLLVLVGVLLIVSFFLPSSYKVERSTEINAPASVVFDQVNTLKNWENWSPWRDIDPTMVTTYNETAAGEGAKAMWTGNKSGNGEQTIIVSEPAKHLQMKLVFKEPDKMESDEHWMFEEKDGKTKVTWSMEGKLDWPIGRFFGLFMDKMLGKDFEKGLTKLKEVGEKSAAVGKTSSGEKGEITEKEVKAQMIVSIRETVSSTDKISAKLGEMYGKLMGYLKKNNAEPAGIPMAIWHEFAPEKKKIDMEAALPVSKEFKAEGEIKFGKTYEGKVVSVIHWGSYESSEATYKTIEQWMKDNKKSPAGPPWEVYITDPVMEKDTAKWQTEIVFPIK